MKASIDNPIYYPVLIDSIGNKYDIKKAVTSLILSQAEKELSVKATVTIVNNKVEKIGKTINQIVALDNDLIVYCDYGEGLKEVFRGTAWTKTPEKAVQDTIDIVVYDLLIFLQKSKDNFFFEAGTRTVDAIQFICKKWGIELDYRYGWVNHPQTVQRGGHISDSIIELLDFAKKNLHKDYVIYAAQNKVIVDYTRSNTRIYSVRAEKNALSVKETETKEGMVTKVIVNGKEGDDDKTPILATVSGNTGKYGTLQDIISKSDDTDLAQARAEADEILAEKGAPILSKTISGVDNPLIKKGDAVSAQGGTLNGVYTVLSIEHDAVKKTMTLEVK